MPADYGSSVLFPDPVPTQDVAPPDVTEKRGSPFQAASTKQGEQFAAQCDLLLEGSGFHLRSRCFAVRDLGVEIDRVATSPRGNEIWFEYKGSVQGARPGLLRTDTMKKAIANGALLQAIPDHPPYIVLTSHVPGAGAGLAMLQAARQLGYLDDVICIYTPSETARLKSL